MPVHSTERCSTSWTNNGTSADRIPIAPHESAKFAASAARYAGSRNALPSVVRDRAAGSSRSASGVSRRATRATVPATARVAA